MLSSKKGNTAKPFCEIPSALTSPSQTDSSDKKKLFKRKPAYTFNTTASDFKPNILQFSTADISVIQPIYQNLSSSKASRIPVPIKQQEKPKFYNRQKNEKQGQFPKFREVFFSPKSQKAIIPKAAGLFQRKPVHNNPSNKSNDLSESFLRSSFAFKKDTSASFENDESLKCLKMKTSSVQSFGALLKSNENKSITVNSQELQIMSNKMNQCQYCVNNKKKAELVQQKYSKLQEQHNIKLKLMKQLTTKYDKLRKDYQQLNSTYQDLEEKLVGKEKQFEKMKEEFIQRIQFHKKDIHCLTQTIKYNQIQKSMLLRYKKQNQELLKQCELLKYDNQQYKKQIIIMVNRQHGYNYNHQRHQNNQQSREPTLTKQFSKKNQNGKQNIYFDCQDDTVSLSFSQQSLDYI